MTQTELITIAREVEIILEQHNVHLTTDRFNALSDYIDNLIAEIEENGE